MEETQRVPALDVRSLWAGYEGVPAIEDVTFQVTQGDFMGIIGPNGSGKSTLFKAILGLLKPWRGQVRVFGHEAQEIRALVGYVPQIESVDWDFPVNVEDVTLMGRYSGLGLFRRPSATDKQAAEEALARVGILNLRKQLIGDLSGGQRRRVLVARAMAGNPKLLLLDEPMAGLDATTQHSLLDLLAELKDTGTTVVMSTHDLSCVSMACDRACCLSGHIVAMGKPTEVLTEQILGETFGQHLLTVHADGTVLAYQHHVHRQERPRRKG